jgi:hypothetical protein
MLRDTLKISLLLSEKDPNTSLSGNIYPSKAGLSSKQSSS